MKFERTNLFALSYTATNFFFYFIITIYILYIYSKKKKYKDFTIMYNKGLTNMSAF